MSINAVIQVKLRTCEEHDNTIIVFAGDFCPMCAALEDLKEATEDLEELFNKDNDSHGTMRAILKPTEEKPMEST